MKQIEEVVVFTGEEALNIGLPLFLMHPAIEMLDGKGIAQMYQATLVYASLIEGWLGHADCKSLLSGSFEIFPLFA